MKKLVDATRERAERYMDRGVDEWHWAVREERYDNYEAELKLFINYNR